MEDPFLDLSDHGLLRVYLPPQHVLPPALEPSAGPRTFVRWEPGGQDAWAEHLAAPERVTAIQEALQLGNPDAEALELERLLLAACAELGLTRMARPHNPN